MISNRVEVVRYGQMVQGMKDILIKEKNMVKVHYILLMDHGIKETFIIMIYMVMVYLCGLITKGMRANGHLIKCVESVKLYGLMVKYIMVNIKLIGNMDMADSHGLTPESMRDSGSMENNMESVSIPPPPNNINTENGNMVKELNGFRMILLIKPKISYLKKDSKYSLKVIVKAKIKTRNQSPSKNYDFILYVISRFCVN